MRYTDEMRALEKEHRGLNRDFEPDEIIEIISNLSRLKRDMLIRKMKKKGWR